MKKCFSVLKVLGLPPSPLADDSTWLRRVTIDIAGRLPTVEETQTFLANKGDNKYEQTVDRLLSTPDYAYYFAGKWGRCCAIGERWILTEPGSVSRFTVGSRKVWSKTSHSISWCAKWWPSRENSPTSRWWRGIGK